MSSSSESNDGVVILKEGKKLVAEFNCDVCGCQYSVPAKNCNIFTTVGTGRWPEYPLVTYSCTIGTCGCFTPPFVTHSCPCCGFTNQCNVSDLKECDTPIVYVRKG